MRGAPLTRQIIESYKRGLKAREAAVAVRAVNTVRAADSSAACITTLTGTQTDRRTENLLHAHRLLLCLNSTEL